MESIFDQLDRASLPPGELTAAEAALLRRKLDRDRERRWATELSKKGVRREAPVRLFSFNKNWRLLAVAAAMVAALASANWLWRQPSKGLSAPKLAANGLPVFHFQGNLRGPGGERTKLVEAVKAYEAGRFESSLALAVEVAQSDKSWKPELLAGLCLLFDPARPDFAAALGHLDRALAQPDAPVEARIYHAFALKKTGQAAAARAELEKLKGHPQIRGQFAEAVERMLR